MEIEQSSPSANNTPQESRTPVEKNGKMNYESWAQLCQWIGKGRSESDTLVAINSLLSEGNITIDGITPESRLDSEGNLVLDASKKLILSYSRGVLRDGAPVSVSIQTPVVYPSRRLAIETQSNEHLKSNLSRLRRSFQSNEEERKHLTRKISMISGNIATAKEGYFDEGKYEETAKYLEYWHEKLWAGLRNEERIERGEPLVGKERNPMRFTVPIIGLRKPDGTVDVEELTYIMQNLALENKSFELIFDNVKKDSKKIVDEYKETYEELKRRDDVPAEERKWAWNNYLIKE